MHRFIGSTLIFQQLECFILSIFTICRLLYLWCTVTRGSFGILKQSAVNSIFLSYLAEQDEVKMWNLQICAEAFKLLWRSTEAQRTGHGYFRVHFTLNTPGVMPNLKWMQKYVDPENVGVKCNYCRWVVCLRKCGGRNGSCYDYMTTVSSIATRSIATRTTASTL